MYAGRRELKKFVRSTEESPLKWKDHTSETHAKKRDVFHEASLDGEEIKKFYETLVNEKKTFNCDIEKEVSIRDLSKKRRAKSFDERNPPSVNKQKELPRKANTKYIKRSTSPETGENSSSSIRTCSNIVANSLFKNSQEGNLKMVMQAIDSGVNINSKDPFGWTPLMAACCSGHIDIVTFLLQQGADLTCVDRKGRNAEVLAKKNKHSKVVSLLQEGVHDESLSSGFFDSQQITDHFCAVCKGNFKESEKKHLTSTLHLFNMKLKGKNTSYFLPESNRGFQMMVKHGWDADKGLGSEGQGRKFPVQTLLKRDRHGLGSKHLKKEIKPRVTHFSANDTAAISEPKAKERKLRVATLSKKKREKKESREKRWERNLRNYMNSE